VGGGGGASAYEAEPDFQRGVQSTGYRTSPDVSMVADPSTGAWIADPYNLPGNNPWAIVGGTSLSAPSWAGLFALANQGRVAAGLATLNTSSPTETQQALYHLPEVDFTDVTAGGNGTYNAGVGYDLATGLGTPVANLLIPGLAGYTGAVSSHRTVTVTAQNLVGNGSGVNDVTDVSRPINALPVFNAVIVALPGKADTPSHGSATVAVSATTAPAATAMTAVLSVPAAAAAAAPPAVAQPIQAGPSQPVAVVAPVAGPDAVASFATVTSDGGTTDTTAATSRAAPAGSVGGKVSAPAGRAVVTPPDGTAISGGPAVQAAGLPAASAALGGGVTWVGPGASALAATQGGIGVSVLLAGEGGTGFGGDVPVPSGGNVWMGSSGSEVLIGGGGSDVHIGERGRNLMVGGFGSDTGDAGPNAGLADLPAAEDLDNAIWADTGDGAGVASRDWYFSAGDQADDVLNSIAVQED
jgi:hypothetical protein